MVEIALWVAAAAMVSPLAIYAGQESMPLVALFIVAGGIALAIALAGRQLHAVLLSDALAGRTGASRLVLAAGMMLLVVLLVLLGAVVTILLIYRSASGGGDPVLGLSAAALS